MAIKKNIKIKSASHSGNRDEDIVRIAIVFAVSIAFIILGVFFYQQTILRYEASLNGIEQVLAQPLVTGPSGTDALILEIDKLKKEIQGLKQDVNALKSSPTQ